MAVAGYPAFWVNVKGASALGAFLHVYLPLRFGQSFALTCLHGLSRALQYVRTFFCFTKSYLSYAKLGQNMFISPHFLFARGIRPMVLLSRVS